MSKLSKTRTYTFKEKANQFLHWVGAWSIFGVGAATVEPTFILFGSIPSLWNAFFVRANLIEKLQNSLPKLKKEIELRDYYKAEDQGYTFDFYALIHDLSVQKKALHIEQEIKKYSEQLGLKKVPFLSFLRDKDLQETDEKKSKNPFKAFFKNHFNKYANAMAVVGERNAVMLSEPLVNTLSDRELEAVAAHEVGHCAAQHTIDRNLMSLVLSPVKLATTFNLLVMACQNTQNFSAIALSIASSSMARKYYSLHNKPDVGKFDEKREFEAFKSIAVVSTMTAVSLHLGAHELLAAFWLNFGVKRAATLLEKSKSRRDEYQADRIAAEVTGRPEFLVSSLEKVGKYNLSFEGMKADRKPIRKQQDIISKIFDVSDALYRTHPSTSSRSQKLLSMDI